jgi:predicted DCC family thiol-disulfide oxidoreductase YuxK
MSAPAAIPENIGKKGGPALVLYDGVCVLCSGWFRFVAKRDRQRKFLFTAIQSDYGRALAQTLGIDPIEPQTNAVLLNGEVYLYSDSALAALAILPGWQWTRVAKVVPKPLRDRAYRIIARNRYKLLGKRAACDLGGAQFADRVIS